MNAPRPENENERLEALRSYFVLDTDPEIGYDDLTALASSICGKPISAISFLDETRQWFKSVVGADVRELPREVSFCSHTVSSGEDVFVVPDAAQDPRFATSELVVGPIGVRFYAGVPLRTPEGLSIGALCVADRAPGVLTEEQRAALGALARQATTQLELRRTNRSLRNQTAELSDARDRALAAAKAKETFLANMSHEIRTPMNGVLGLASLLRETPLDGRQRRFVDTIDKSARALLGVLDEVFDLAKMEHGPVALQTETVHPADFLSDLAAMYRTEAEAKGLGLRVKTDVRTPLRGDFTRVRQGLTNLLDNALKFTASGEVTLGAEVANATPDTVFVRFTVEDTGIGIQPDQQPGLGEPFRQADSSSTRRFGGAGLGLSLTRRLAELLSGRFGFESVPGEGSTFWIEVPLTPVEGGEVIHLNVPGPGGSIEGSRILVVEDNAINSLVISAMLERNGCEVRIVENGRLAVEALTHDRFDLVLMDIQMPEMDGIEATRRLRLLDDGLARLPVIALTASVLDCDRIACHKAGMNDYLSKPVSEEIVMDTLRRWLCHRWMA